MILAAALMVLLGLGLFVAGVLTGVTAFYWGCVAACVGAAVLLFLARRNIAKGSAPAAADTTTAGTTTATGKPAEAGQSTPAGGGATAAGLADPAADTRHAVETATPDEPEPEPEAAQDLPDPPVEEVEVTDLLLVVDLKDEVLVIDEHPRYHLAGCVHVAGRTTIPLPLDEARTDGFTPCAVCAPDRTLADRARSRKRAAPGS